MSRAGSGEVHATTVRELRQQIRTWRRGRADTRLVDALGDAYIAVFATVMLTSMAASVVVDLRDVAGQECTSVTCVDARTALPWVFGLTVVTGCLGLARLLGPMLVSPATGSWLLTAPVDRAALLRPRLLGTGLVAVVAGALLCAGGATLAGFAPGAVASFTGTAAALCLGVVGLACASQAGSGALARVLGWGLAGVVWAGLVALTVGVVPGAAPPAGGSTGWFLAGAVSAVLALAALARAHAVLPRLHRDQLTPGGTLVPGLSGALSSLDFALVYDILLSRRWLARSTVRPVRGRGSGVGVLVWRDVVRLWRSPRALLVLAAAVVLPYLTGTLGLGRLTVLVAALTGFLAGLGLFSALRVVSRTPSLVRCLPFEPWQVKGACVVVPGVALLGFGLGLTPLVRTAEGVDWRVAAVTGLAVGVAALVAATRWMTGRPPNYQLPLVTSPMGAVPTSLYASAARGFDVLVLVAAPLLLAPGPHGAEASLGLGAAVLAFLLGRA